MSERAPRRRRTVAAVALTFGAGLTAVLAIGWMRLGATLRGDFGPENYARLFTEYGWSRYGLPATLPANARDTRIHAPASAPSLLPWPDQYVEVRFMLPVGEAEALLASARATSAGVKVDTLPSYDFMISSLRTAHDRNEQTALPETFESVIITNPSGANVGGVSVDLKSGEIVYWIFES